MQATKSKSKEQKTISIFFGSRHQKTFKEFEALSKEIRRSRTGTIHHLLENYQAKGGHQGLEGDK